jgi:hypothetical protein
LNLAFYLIGVSIRFFFFGLVALGVFGLHDHRWIQGIICLLVGFGFIWGDSQRAEDPKDWLKSKLHTLE